MRTWILLGLFAAMPAWADWSFIAKTEAFNLYGEANTKRKTGNLVRLWSMADYNAVQSIRLPPPLLWTSYQSMRELKEFDCVSRQHRSVKTQLYAGRLAKGEPLYGFTPDAGLPLGFQPATRAAA